MVTSFARIDVAVFTIFLLGAGFNIGYFSFYGFEFITMTSLEDIFLFGGSAAFLSFLLLWAGTSSLISDEFRVNMASLNQDFRNIRRFVPRWGGRFPSHSRKRIVFVVFQAIALIYILTLIILLVLYWTAFGNFLLFLVTLFWLGTRLEDISDVMDGDMEPTFYFLYGILLNLFLACYFAGYVYAGWFSGSKCTMQFNDEVKVEAIYLWST